MYEGTIFFGRQGAVIQAMSGVEIALWDIVGKATERPVYQLLGGGFRKKFRAYASILFGDTPAETEAHRPRAGPARASAPSSSAGARWARARRATSPMSAPRGRGWAPDVELMVDAGLCWDTATAIRRAKQFEPFNLTWLEEPLHPDNRRGLRPAVRAESRCASPPGEEICDVEEFQQLMDVGGIDVVQVDVTRVGGLARSKRIGWDSAERHRLCVNHSYKTGVNIAASLHFVAALPNTHYFEYCVEQGALRQTLTKQRFPGDRRRHRRAGGAGPGHRAGRGGRGEVPRLGSPALRRGKDLAGRDDNLLAILARRAPPRLAQISDQLHARRAAAFFHDVRFERPR